ncbi:MAG: hypothetical protein KDJ33_06610 [Gammaproteobacteria bacterium]|nr:hypothetical protein [Gammaproteobacteria bacterium]
MALATLVRRIFAHDASPCERLAALIGQLRHRQRELESHLAAEPKPARRRHLQLKLTVNRLQQRKGVERQQQLRGRCR